MVNRYSRVASPPPPEHYRRLVNPAAISSSYREDSIRLCDSRNFQEILLMIRRAGRSSPMTYSSTTPSYHYSSTLNWRLVNSLSPSFSRFALWCLRRQ